MRAYKGFDKDLKCRDKQYEIGKTENEPTAKLCEKGFHACGYPLDTFNYYAPSDSRYCAVTLDGITGETSSNDSKRVGTSITVEAEIGIKGIVDASVEFVLAYCKNGGKGANRKSDNSIATNTGDQSAATNTGDQSAATVCGEKSVAISLGVEGKAKGSKGCWIVIAEWEGTGAKLERIDVKAFYVDGENIKADTFYILKDGKPVEAK